MGYLHLKRGWVASYVSRLILRTCSEVVSPTRPNILGMPAERECGACYRIGLSLRKWALWQLNAFCTRLLELPLLHDLGHRMSFSQ